MRTARTAFGTGLAIAICLGVASSPVRAERPEDLRREAKRLAHVGQFREALDVLDGLLKRKPRDVEFRAFRGEILLRLNRPEEALADFDAASRIDPLYPVPSAGESRCSCSAGPRKPPSSSSARSP
jgi:predicted Zn-dependent protease